MKVWQWSGVLAVAAVTLAGCGSQRGSASRVSTVTTATSAAVAVRAVGGGPAAWTSCRQELGSRWPVAFTTDTLTLKPLSRDFDPVSVVVCTEQTQTRADGGQELVATEQRSTDLAALDVLTQEVVDGSRS